MSVDWSRLRGVVLESDDWGMCAWTPDAEAYRSLAIAPAFRTPAGLVYGRSTLESALDVIRLKETLLVVRGGDELPPVLQANTVMAAPDFDRIEAPFESDPLPIVRHPETPSRWARPGMWEELQRAVESGVWHPELHGLHHLPERAWLASLRKGDVDARRAFENQCTVCRATEASGEYAASEPEELRERNLRLAVECFRAAFDRLPGSLCPPDYRWDERLEHHAERLGIFTFQGKAEQARPLLRLRRRFARAWPRRRGARLYMPPRIAFEPRGGDGGKLGATRVHGLAREAWRKGRPAVISTHRVNYAHLDEGWSANGRLALADLLRRLAADRATFLTDTEARALEERGWSVRLTGQRGAIVRCHGDARGVAHVPVPTGTIAVVMGEGNGGVGSVTIEDGAALITLEPGACVIEWRRA